MRDFRVRQTFPTSQDFGDGFTDIFLLYFNRELAIDDRHIKLAHHLLIFVDDALLKQAEAGYFVFRQAKIHTGFIIFYFCPGRGDPFHRHIQRNPEIKHQIGLGGEGI